MIAVIIFIISIFSFGMMCGPWVVSYLDGKETFITGWEFLQSESGVNGFLMFKIFAIAMLVLAIVIMILSLLKFLNMLGLMKFDVTVALFFVSVLFAFSTIFASVGAIFACVRMTSVSELMSVEFYPYFCLFIQMILGVVVGLISLLLLHKKVKNG